MPGMDWHGERFVFVPEEVSRVFNECASFGAIVY